MYHHLITLGLYSRGKSQVLRMACVIEIMNQEMEKKNGVDNEVADVVQDVVDIVDNMAIDGNQLVSTFRDSNFEKLKFYFFTEVMTFFAYKICKTENKSM